MDRSIVRIPAYIAFGLAVFFVALVLTFPDQRIKEIATVQLESQLGNKYDVEIEDLDLWWLSGVELENITLTERFTESSDDGEDDDGEESEDGDQDRPEDAPPADEPLDISIPRIAAGFSVLSTVANFAPAVDFLIDLGGGDIDGKYIHGSDQRRVEVDFDDVELGKTAIIESYLGVPVLGTLSGDAQLDFHPQRPLLTGGHVTLAGRKLMVDEATLHTDELGAMAFVDVPPTSFGSLDADLVIEKPEGSSTPTVDFERFEFHDGRDVRGQVWGDLELGQSMATSEAKLEMRFQFDENYIQSNDLSSLLQMKWFREGKAKDWYGFMLWGRMSSPRFKGAPTAANGPDQGGDAEDAEGADDN